MRLCFVHGAIGGLYQSFGGPSVVGVSGNSDAHGQWRLLAIGGQSRDNPFSDFLRGFFVRFDEQKNKFITTIPAGCVDRPAAQA